MYGDLPSRSCYYCTTGRAATHVVHDKRGCWAVCETHAAWRMTTSLRVGHDRECLQKAEVWRHVTKIPKAS